MQRTRSLLVLLGLGALLTVLVAAPAQAAGYRYWSFWQSTDGRWAYATEGPATARPADGSVHGFRFSVSEDSGDSAKPRTAPDFEAICAKTPAKDGTKRIALVIDPGTATDAPHGETPPDRRATCVQVDEAATTAEALARVAKPLRYNSQALLCAISGYPKSGCGEQISQPAAKPETTEATEASTDDGAGPSVGVYAGIAAILALTAATVWQSRRRKR